MGTVEEDCGHLGAYKPSLASRSALVARWTTRAIGILSYILQNQSKLRIRVVSEPCQRAKIFCFVFHEYPQAPAHALVEDFHGEDVADPHGAA